MRMNITNVAALPAASIIPNENDVIVFDPSVINTDFNLHQKGNSLLCDLVCLHHLILTETRKERPKNDDILHVEKLSSHLFKLLHSGHDYLLPDAGGLTQSFLKGNSRFLEKVKENGAISWKTLDDIRSRDFIASVIRDIATLRKPGANDAAALEDALFERDANPVSGPPGFHDIILINRGSINSTPNLKTEGKDRFLGLMDQYLSTTSDIHNMSMPFLWKRAEAALAIMNVATERANVTRKSPGQMRRFLVIDEEASNSATLSCYEVDRTLAAELALIIIFEKLSKNVHPRVDEELKQSQTFPGLDEQGSLTMPGNTPISHPAAHDVLFGRGGLTNNHCGNRRFRDVISLHRPDYIRAMKNEKPNVARRIVKAIRCGNPPGRFLKKDPRGNKWYDVGDRDAAAKTSQALREKTRLEKLEILNGKEDERKRKFDEIANQLQESVLKRTTNNPSPNASRERVADVPQRVMLSQPYYGILHQPPQGNMNVSHYGPYGVGLRMSDVSINRTGVYDSKRLDRSDSPEAKDIRSGISSQRSNGDLGEVGRKAWVENEIKVPDNSSDKGAVKSIIGEYSDSLKNKLIEPFDKEGNINVTDYDILCGRGGLTNHHRGNKRFRDVVSLHRPDYVRAVKVQKPAVARLIVKAIRNSEPPGRFLKKSGKTLKWYDIGDKKAAVKASQALREKVIEEQRGLEMGSHNVEPHAHIVPRLPAQFYAPYNSSLVGAPPFISTGSGMNNTILNSQAITRQPGKDVDVPRVENACMLEY